MFKPVPARECRLYLLPLLVIMRGEKMITKILVAFDGYPHSVNALQYAISLAENMKDYCSITVINVQPHRSSYIWPEVSYHLHFEKALQEDKELIEKELNEVISKTSVTIDVQFMNGDPAIQICKFAKENNYSLVVLGSRRRNLIAELASGRVRDEVIQRSTRNVLIVK